MENIIFDGEAHALSDEFGYIADKVEKFENIQDIQEIIDEQLQTYAEYLYEHNKNKVLDYLVSIFRSKVMREEFQENLEIIYRPPHLVGCLAQYGTLCLKFERAEIDNLEKNAEDRKRCCCR